MGSPPHQRKWSNDGYSGPAIGRDSPPGPPSRADQASADTKSGEVAALRAICEGVLRSGVLPLDEAERIRGIVAACGEWAINSAKQTGEDAGVSVFVAEISLN